MDDMGHADAHKIEIARTFSLFPDLSRARAAVMDWLLSALLCTTTTGFGFFLSAPGDNSRNVQRNDPDLNLLLWNAFAIIAACFIMLLPVTLAIVRNFFPVSDSAISRLPSGIKTYSQL
ncbi:MAG: hypothetical protein ACYDDO_07200 [Acidiferrobacterales bacterium]